MTDSHYKTFGPIAAGLLALSLILTISYKYGLAMSPDSACYLSIAENILKGNGFVIYDLKPVAVWPPLYPLSLTIGGSTEFGIIPWARLLNALLFGLILFFTSRWLFSKVSNLWLASVGVLAVLLSLPLIYVAKHAWSETLFILFVILFLMRLEKSFAQHSITDVLVLGIFTAVAVLTRYIGITLFFFYFIWLLLFDMNLKKKIVRGAIYSLVSLTPLLFWVWRNYQVTGTLLGNRSTSSSSFFKNLVHFSDSVSIWFLPENLHPEIRVIAIGVLIILALAWYFRKNLSRIIKEGFSQFLLINWGFLLVYSGYLLLASTLVAFDVITHRLTSPIYIPLIVSVVFALAQTKKFHISLRIIGNLLIVAWMYYLGLTTYSEITRDLKEGAGSYAHYYWQNMSFPKSLADNPPDGKLYSNFPDAVYVLSDLPASISPQRHQYQSTDSTEGDLKILFDEITRGENIYLAWFKGPGRSFLHTPEELEEFFELETIDSQSVGVLYKLEMRTDSI